MLFLAGIATVKLLHLEMLLLRDFYRDATFGNATLS